MAFSHINLDALGTPPGRNDPLDLHSMRHSYVTNLIETGFPERFVTDQVGHAYAATTAILHRRV